MRVAVVGRGGREMALRHVLSRTAELVDDPDAADLCVIGPEQPLVDGLADQLRARGRLVFGPGADGARLEGSKGWMKQVLGEAGVPTARHGTFTALGPAVEFLRALPGPYVVKTDGLAAGKGVLVTPALDEAAADVGAKLERGPVVIEEGLAGPELSVLAVCDGRRAVPLVPAQDFKRIGTGDVGPNTGGMGAYSPVPLAGPDVVDEVMAKAVEPTLARLQALGVDYRGVLYAGLMLTAEGPKVLEFNVRFGDPEAQVVLPLFAGDLAAFLASAAAGRLDEAELSFTAGAAVCVVLASEGYPVAPRTGDAIAGIDDARSVEGVLVFKADGDPAPVTAGGRVLNVVGQGPSLADARRRAYDAVGRISWPGLQFRTDIALEASQS
jgi:phosphoribosylamine---glycine ligase